MSHPLSTSPPPLGIGTAHCESLSGYVQRLAALHGSRPGQIVFRVLAWIDQGRSVNAGRWASTPGRLLPGNNINGFNQADSWLRALQYATKRSNLDCLTTRGWDANFPTRGFLSSHLAWCPLCLTTDGDPYQRLVWLINPVRACLVHRIPLQRRCVRCKRALPVLHDRSLVLSCPHCGGDLRHALADTNASAPTEFDIWSATEVGRLVAGAAAWHIPLSWNPTLELNALARARHLQAPAAFARAVGTSKITAWYWLTGKARPSLPLALHVFHRLGDSLATRLGCPPGAAPLAPVGAQPEFHLGKVRRMRDRNWAVVRRLMLAELKKPAGGARPLREVAQLLTIPVRLLRAHFPDLCRALSDRHRSRRGLERAKRDERLTEQIHAAMAVLARQHVVLSKRNIEKLFRRPGLFNSHYARRLYEEARGATLPA